MNGEVEDVKPGSESSTQPTDATPESSTGATTTAESSTAGAKEPSSIAEALEKVQLEQPEEAGNADNSGEQTTGESPTTEAETGEAKTDESAGTKDGQPAKEGEAAADSDVPFHNRKEWKQAIEIGGDKIKPILRQILQSETRANEQVRALQPKASIVDEMRSIVGGEQEFNTMRQVVRQFAAGDPAVLPILRQMVQTIEKSSGEVISSTDLMDRQTAIQRQFDEGLIDQAEFQTQIGLLKEVERNRAGKRAVETRLQATTQQQQRQEIAAQTRATTEAINSWESNIRSRDPDFGNVTDVNDPKHGESVADQVFDAMTLKVTHKPNASMEELLSAAQRAYDLAKRRAPAPVLRQQRAATSQRSSINGLNRPKTMREAMDAVKLE